MPEVEEGRYGLRCFLRGIDSRVCPHRAYCGQCSQRIQWIVITRTDRNGYRSCPRRRSGSRETSSRCSRPGVRTAVPGQRGRSPVRRAWRGRDGDAAVGDREGVRAGSHDGCCIPNYSADGSQIIPAGVSPESHSSSLPQIAINGRCELHWRTSSLSVKASGTRTTVPKRSPLPDYSAFPPNTYRDNLARNPDDSTN